MEKILIHIIPTLENGGAETVLNRLSKELKTKGIIQKVITTQGDDSNYHFSSIAKNCEVIHAKTNPTAVQQTFKGHPNAKIIAWMYPAIIHAHRWKIRFRTQQPILWNIRRSHFPAKKKFQRLALYFFGGYARLMHIRVIYCAHQAQKAHRRFFFPKKNSVVIQNRWAKIMNTSQEQPAPEARDYLLYVGRNHPAKGPDRLVRVAHSLLRDQPNLQLLIAGRDWHIDFFPSEIHNQVSVLGNVSHLFPHYTHTKGLLLTSYTEGYPNVLVEAAVCGTPIVSYPAGDASTILANYPHGHIAHNYEEFIQKVKHLITHPPSAQVRQKAARRIQKELDFSHTVRDYMKFIFDQAV